MNKSSQQGVAIIMVLMVVALATTLSAYIAAQQHWWQRQLENQLDRAQARRIGVAAIDWARAILAEDARLSNIDHPNELWTTQLPAVPVENGEVIGAIEDRQGLFNINNLARNGKHSPTDIAQFKRLLTLLDLPPTLAESSADWIDKDSEMLYPGGAEDVYYLSQEPPYRSANAPLTTLNELVLVKGFNREIIARLRPYVTALPQNTPINVNFASAEVMTAVIDGLSLSQARLLTRARTDQPFENLKDFKKRLPSEDIIVDELHISMASSFFKVSGRANMGNIQLDSHALLHRNGGWPAVIWQSIQ